MNDHGQQRYADRRGWLRNRRWLELDDEGVTVVRWFDPPLRIRWAELTALRRGTRGRVVMVARRGNIVLDRHVRGRQTIIDAAVAALRSRAQEDAPRHVAPRIAEAWLAGFRHASGAPDAPDKPAATVLISAFPGLGLGAALAGVVVGHLGASEMSGQLLLLLVALCSLPPWFLIYWACGGLQPLQLEGCQVAADGTTIVYQPAQGDERVFTWSQIVRLREGDGVCLVELRDAEPVALPAFEAFWPLIHALRRCVDSAPARLIDDVGLPDTGLSLVRDQHRLTDGERGLSRTAEIEAGKQ